jgi:hypothetical protein
MHFARWRRAALDVMSQLRVMMQERVPMRTVSSIPELEQALHDAALQAKGAGLLNIIFLYAPNEDHLSLVVGGDETVVGFNYGHGNPPYFASEGESEAAEPVLTAYVSLEHHTEFPRRCVVPMELGRRAAVEFLSSGERPRAVRWAEL